jgi:hypothetical protein
MSIFRNSANFPSACVSYHEYCCLLKRDAVKDMSNLEMEPAGSSEVFVNFYQNKQQHIPEDSILHGHCHQDL